MHIKIPSEYHSIALRYGRQTTLNLYEVLMETPSSFLVEIPYGASYITNAIYKSSNYDEDKHRTGKYCWVSKNFSQIEDNFKDNEGAASILQHIRR